MADCASVTTASTAATTPAASYHTDAAAPAAYARGKNASDQLVQWRWDAPRHGALQCISGSPTWSDPLPTGVVLQTLLSHAGSRFEWRRSRGVVVRIGARELNFGSPEGAVRSLLAETNGDVDTSTLVSTSVPMFSSKRVDPFGHLADHPAEDAPLANSALSSRAATPRRHAMTPRSSSAASWSQLLDDAGDCSTPRMRSAMHSISASRIGASRSASCGPQGFGSESDDIRVS